MLNALGRKLHRRIAPWQRRLATRHLHGPARVDLAEDQVMLVALMRDAAWFLDLFLDHHFALGVAHILVIDNGSTDQTVALCQRRDRVTVLQNTLPAKVHESALRSELAQRVAGGGWLLFADSDELAELPLPIPRLLHWCNSRGYTAVLGQMLDRFSLAPYAQLKELSYRQAVAAMDHYALNAVEAMDYHDRDAVPFHWFLRDNICDAPKHRFMRGGMRAEVFGEQPFLSKHSLVKNVRGVVPMSHPHCASGVRVADVSLLLHHYKLAGDWIGRDARSVAGGYWAHGEDERRLAMAEAGADLQQRVAAPLQWAGIAALQDAGFLYASPAFLAAQAEAAEAALLETALA